jgi:predicted RNase H-like nuclease (RuvC/YqgF family)
MIYTTRRWNVAMLIVFLLLLTGLACVGSLRAQLKKEEVDFEVLATVTAMSGKDCCLWNMAAKHYGDPYKWTILKEVNKIPNERRISKGTVIYIPVLPIKKKVEEPVKPKEPSEIDLMREEISHLKKQNEECEARNRELVKALEDCKKQSKKMADQAKALKKCRQENKKLKGKLEELEGRNRELVKAMKEKDGIIEELEERLRKMKGDLRRCEEELEEAMAKKDRHIEELESELHKCRRELEEIESAQMAKKHKYMVKSEVCKREPPRLGKGEYHKDDRALVAAVAIAIVGSLIWIGSD